MADHGERNKPLLNTEYGILNDIGGSAQVNQFLTSTFDYMFNATDDATGYPADKNRLVQGWLWYSLNDNQSYFQYGTLFNTSYQLTTVGNGWKNYLSTHPIASQPQRNLLAVNLRAQPNPAIVPPGQTATITLRADIANSGNITTSTGNNILVRFWNGTPNQPGSTIIGSQTVADIPGCGRHVTTQVTWPRPAGEHTWYVQVVPISGETTTADNIASSTVSVYEALPKADLAVSKLVNNPRPYTGQRINYTVTVRNNGPDDVTAVKVNDLLPAGLTFKSYTATRGNYYTSGIWEVGDLPKLASAILVIHAAVNNGQGGKTITNTAQASSAAGQDSVPANNSGSVKIVPIESKILYLPHIQKR
jgi:uncharacterized repeat protein (TIGR01451 family)